MEFSNVFSFQWKCLDSLPEFINTKNKHNMKNTPPPKKYATVVRHNDKNG